MKINFILPHVGVAGGVRVVFEYANRLSECGHEVTVLYPTIPSRINLPWLAPRPRIGQTLSTFQRLLRKTEIEWFDLKVKLKQIPSLAPQLSNLTEMSVPDADVTVATAWQTAYFVDALSDTKGEKAYFVQHYEVWPLWNSPSCWEKAVEYHSDPSIGMVDIVPDDRELAKYKRLVDQSYSLPLNLIITSEWEKRVMERMNEPIAGTTSYGVSFDQFYPTSMEGATDFTLLALYRNSQHKGDSEAIGSFSRIHERHDNIEFIMFGSERGNDIPSFVDFYADLPQDELRDLYSRADLFIYPSWVEGYGMPPMEAMACRTGLISTDVGAVREYTPPEGVRFVPIQDVDAIVSEIEMLLDRRREVEEMKETNFKYIQRYSWERATKQFEQILINIKQK